MHQAYQIIAKLTLALVLLQFAGTGFGAHQLHQGNEQEEARNHAHLQFTAEVTSIAQCTEELIQSANHQHIISDIEEYDLCLDCQCHGGHASLVTQTMIIASEPLTDLFLDIDSHYFPPELSPNYRPPIA